MRKKPVNGRAFRSALVLAVLVISALLTTAGPAAASGNIVIDSFTAGGGSWHTCGNSFFVYQQDPSILGRARELALRDGGSCHFGPFPAQMSVDTVAGTASWGGPNTYSPEQHFSYGTEIGTQANVPWSPNPNVGKGTPLHLALTLSDQIEIDMVSVNNPYMWIRLRDSNDQTYTANVVLTVGTNLVPLSAFSGLSAGAASDIDGISFNGSNKNPVDTVAEFSIKGGDSTPPAANPTASPAANGAGWNNSDVTVNWNWTDSGSGINPANCTQSSTSSGEGALTLLASCADNAGNVGSASYTVQVDKTAPTIAFSGARNYTVDQTVSIACSATDSLSGIASASCPGASGVAWSFGLGAHTLSASATDNAGNSSSSSVTFTVAVDATSLCNLVTSWAGNAGIANSLCVKLQAASAAGGRGQTKTKQNVIGAFDNEVSAQSGKAFTASRAALLVAFAAAV